MIIYNVTIKTDPSITESWLDWMKSEHLAEMMGTGLFQKHVMSRLLEDDADGDTFVVQYFCDNYERYLEYLERYAPQMRAKGIEKFGDKVIGFRTVMEVLS